MIIEAAMFVVGYYEERALEEVVAARPQRLVDGGDEPLAVIDTGVRRVVVIGLACHAYVTPVRIYE